MLSVKELGKGETNFRDRNLSDAERRETNPFPDRLDSSPFEDNSTPRFLSDLGERESLVNFPLPISISRDSLIMEAGRKARGRAGVGSRVFLVSRPGTRFLRSARREAARKAARETLLADLFSGREKNRSIFVGATDTIQKRLRVISSAA